MAYHEPPHQDLQCLQIQLFLSMVLKELTVAQLHYLSLVFKIHSISVFYRLLPICSLSIDVKPNRTEAYIGCQFAVLYFTDIVSNSFLHLMNNC